MSLFNYKYLLIAKPKLRISCTEHQGKGEQEEQDLCSCMRLQDGESPWVQQSPQGPDPAGPSWGYLCSWFKQDHFQKNSSYFNDTSVLYKLPAHRKYLLRTSTREVFKN